VEARAEVVSRWCDELERRTADLAEGLTAEVGTPLEAARAVQVGIALALMRAYVDAARETHFEETLGNSLVIREPAGVVGCITAWNLPVILAMQKVPAALIAGCTVVLKPSEITPLNARALAETAAAAGLPAGAFNVVFGDGPTVGEALVRHPAVGTISFTGSTRAGRRVAQVASDHVKRVTLELGGKSANVILDDADLEAAVRAGVDQAFFNAGQSCIVWSRMLVPRERHEDALELARELVEGYVVGDPRRSDTDLGPMVSRPARDRVTAYVRTGVQEGARLVAGGPERPPGLERGWFVRPTLFGDVRPEMTIAREEIFGPVLSVMPYEGEDEAVRIANDSVYGLHGAVWSADDEHALSVARRLQTGRVDVNGGPFNLAAPFGGYKQSGYGREFGRYGIEEFVQLKSVQLPAEAGGLEVGARGGVR
jgi:acyl-CoA reductase-like NAD-dependent aldehyde dehydrogenase